MKDRKPQKLHYLSDKQCIMKAASLLEHKGVFLVFVSPDANIFVYSVFNINLRVSATLRSKNKNFSARYHNFLENSGPQGAFPVNLC